MLRLLLAHEWAFFSNQVQLGSPCFELQDILLQKVILDSLSDVRSMVTISVVENEGLVVGSDTSNGAPLVCKYSFAVIFFAVDLLGADFNALASFRSRTINAVFHCIVVLIVCSIECFELIA